MKRSLSEDAPLVLNFVDYVSAFDAASHNFLDQALSESGAGNKVRAAFIAICSTATARVRVRLPDGQQNARAKYLGENMPRFIALIDDFWKESNLPKDCSSLISLLVMSANLLAFQLSNLLMTLGVSAQH